ncbi:glycine cleavage system aminomethyltransferase GcvT [Clostridium ganghwense]|uniref:Aminomethyltransferase n=1 Tax=Clostridium ganghwense TaxID=312089 RepID=A0ABT4CSS5_9CLOT|nr:glycine cleavage system aminomethyltransferase GcvT [Clostridium ganghwense]MCY6371024.1 glycine cleavage system aminomethyltransferase GcvT [Clostridium ganghwense]
MEFLKRTPLFNAYQKYGGKIINFTGWALPVQFEGIIKEHEAVRNAAGLFDVSHMGEIEIKGEDAFSFLQNLITNDVSVLKDNEILYTLMCFNDGGVADDLLVYKFSDKHYLLVVNASNVDKDYLWVCSNKDNFNVEINNISHKIAQLALQGPTSEKILQKLTPFKLSDIKFFRFNKNVMIDGVKCLVSRTGYTGEDGFEIYTGTENSERLWNKILETGKEDGIKPAGLGCRDTLRFEAALPLYGNELSEDITPLEAGLGYFVKLNKASFIGKNALVMQNKDGVKRRIVGFEMIGRGIPRHGYSIIKNDEEIGFVTTGYFSPTLKKSIGHAILDTKYTKLGTEIEVIIRKKRVRAKIIKKKFYNKNHKK